MKYLCLVYVDRTKLDLVSQLCADGPLQLVQEAAELDVSNGVVYEMQCCLPKRRQRLGAFVVVDARDLNDAIRMASQMLPAFTGLLEVCPITQNEVC